MPGWCAFGRSRSSRPGCRWDAGRFSPDLPRGAIRAADRPRRRRRSLRPGDSVEFYGYGMDTRYSGSAVYWLVAGMGAGANSPPPRRRPRQPARPATWPRSDPRAAHLVRRGAEWRCREVLRSGGLQPGPPASAPRRRAGRVGIRRAARGGAGGRDPGATLGRPHRQRARGGIGRLRRRLGEREHLPAARAARPRRQRRRAGGARAR